MKTAISLPDGTFARAEQAAAQLGVSRSELYARALSHYLDQLERSSVTTRLDAAIERSGEEAESADAAVRAGRRTLTAAGNEW